MHTSKRDRDSDKRNVCTSKTGQKGPHQVQLRVVPFGDCSEELKSEGLHAGKNLALGEEASVGHVFRKTSGDAISSGSCRQSVDGHGGCLVCTGVAFPASCV